jgi:hypothetical protein
MLATTAMPVRGSVRTVQEAKKGACCLRSSCLIKLFLGHAGELEVEALGLVELVVLEGERDDDLARAGERGVAARVDARLEAADRDDARRGAPRRGEEGECERREREGARARRAGHRGRGQRAARRPRPLAAPPLPPLPKVIIYCMLIYILYVDIGTIDSFNRESLGPPFHWHIMLVKIINSP